MSKRSSILVSLLVGAVAGAALGILYAPTEGRNTRNVLTFRLAKYRARLQGLVEELVAQKAALQHDNQARTESRRVISDAQQKAESLLRDVEDLMGQIKSKQ